ncbi:LapA family protein [Sphingomonas sp.]|uniref:LapA family protein n=1 Tax=Sphingomonas sp. TaxID=28214 RepID=UPI002B8B448E|nr:LapA family protein [Sphingomonas sp.]HTG39733.1 LapA family protein [Sphingomonas sp.]
MQFLRTLIWVLVAGIVVAFSFNNWAPVPVKLWGGLVADINLPLLMGVMFLLGFVPLYFLYVGTRWRLKSRLANAERALADLRAQMAAPVPVPDPIEGPAAPLLMPDPAAPETRT